MLAELNQITGIISNVCVITISVWFLIHYFQAKKYLTKYIMADIDKLIDQVEDLQVADSPDNKMKERLIQVVAGGKSKDFLGKMYSTEDIEKLDEKDLAKLYARYEAVLGGQITASLKEHMLTAYTRAIQALCPTVSQGRLAINNPDRMVKSLSDGLFIDLALTSLTCKMYHDFGHLLAPLEAVLLTSNHVVPASYQQTGQLVEQQTELVGQQNITSCQQTEQESSFSYQQVMQLKQQNPGAYQQWLEGVKQRDPTGYEHWIQQHPN